MKLFVYFLVLFFLFAGMADVLDAIRIFGIEVSEVLFLSLAIGGGCVNLLNLLGTKASGTYQILEIFFVC